MERRTRWEIVSEELGGPPYDKVDENTRPLSVCRSQGTGDYGDYATELNHTVVDGCPV